jgi:hypothetical protein
VLSRLGATSSHCSKRRYQAAFSASSVPYLRCSHARKRRCVLAQKQNSGFSIQVGVAQLTMCGSLQRSNPISAALRAARLVTAS